MTADATTPADLRDQARLNREAARDALVEGGAEAVLYASSLHRAAIALEDAAKEMERRDAE